MARISEKLSEKALQCKTLDEIKALAKSEGIELSDEELKEFLDYNNISMGEETLDKVAGGLKFNTFTMSYVTNC